MKPFTLAPIWLLYGGASGRFERYKEYALEYAFLLDLQGIKY
jgi:hypothetical protein